MTRLTVRVQNYIKLCNIFFFRKITPSPNRFLAIFLNKSYVVIKHFCIFLLLGIDYPYMSCGKSAREYILHSAAISILFALMPPFSGEKPEFVKTLKKFLLSSLVPMFTTMHRGVTNQQHCDHAMSNSTVQSQTTPETLSKTSVPSSRSSLSTLKLIEARNLRNEQKKGAQNTRARALDSRIKQQNVAFLDIARDIHHGAKEDGKSC